MECSDVNWPRNWARWDTDTRHVYATAPFEAWDNAWFNAACAYWPVHGPAQPLRIKGAGLPGILMIQGTLDAATPYQGAQVAHRLLPSARMVVVKGGGNHGQSLSQPPNTCVNNYLNAYLGPVRSHSTLAWSTRHARRWLPISKRIGLACQATGRRDRNPAAGCPSGADTLDECCAPRRGGLRHCACSMIATVMRSSHCATVTRWSTCS